jgi:hypothetical protein
LNDFIEEAAIACVHLHRRFRLCSDDPSSYHHELHHVYLLIGLPRSEHLSACTPEQVEALDVVEALAQKHQFILGMQPGDMTFINNWAIMHSREAFENDEAHTRYLIRIWLENEKLAWKLPQALDNGNQMVYYDQEMPESWNIVPEPILKFEIFQTLSP